MYISDIHVAVAHNYALYKYITYNGLEGDMPECLPQGDRKVLKCYVTQ